MSSKLRFSRHSPCDFMIFDSVRRIFLTLELKSFQGSCSFERGKEDKGIIHYYQVKSLKEFSLFKNTYSGFILDFRTTEHTYFLNIKEWDDLIDSVNKKSFNEQDLLNYCTPTLISKRKLKVNWKYDIDKMINDIHDLQPF